MRTRWWLRAGRVGGRERQCRVKPARPGGRPRQVPHGGAGGRACGAPGRSSPRRRGRPGRPAGAALPGGRHVGRRGRPLPPTRHARFHFEAARAAAEIVALAELHPPRLVVAARRAGLFHLRAAAAGGWPRALGVLARLAAGLPSDSALLAGLVAAGVAAGEVSAEEAGSERLAAALAAAGARAGVRSAAAAAAAAAAAGGSDPASAADWLAAALAPAGGEGDGAAVAPLRPAPADADADSAEAEFASLPGGGRARHELLAAGAELAASAGDVAGATAAFEAAAQEATAVGAGKAAVRYWEKAAAVAGGE